AADARRHAPRLWSELYTFGFCREPEARFLSSLRYARERWSNIAGSPGLPQDPEWLDEPERFLSEWVATQPVSRLNYIFQPQHRFLTDSSGVVLVDDVFRLEEIGDSIRRLERNLEQPLSIGVENATEAAGM